MVGNKSEANRYRVKYRTQLERLYDGGPKYGFQPSVLIPLEFAAVGNSRLERFRLKARGISGIIGKEAKEPMKIYHATMLVLELQ